MPHYPKPFFKTTRDVWYVQIRRKQHNLGPDRDEAFRRYHELMASFEPEPAPAAPDELVVTVFDQFLDWCQKHKAPPTYRWYRDRIQAFIRTIETSLQVSDLKPIHVERWVDEHPDWSPSHQRGCKIAVQRAFTWAEKMGVIDRSPVRYLEKPQSGKREQIISEEQYRVILGHFSDTAFRDVVEMAWHTGARPQETIRIEARHVDLPHRRVVLPPPEAKGKKRFRIIYLNDQALELVRKRAFERPTGAIFRNTHGGPWTAWAVNGRFCRLQQALGRKQLETTVDLETIKAFAAKLSPLHTVKGKIVTKTERELLREARKKLTAKEAAKVGVKFCLYAFRHTLANRLLTAGVDSLTVSALLGHVDGTMLSRVYAHLQQSAEHLLGALNRMPKALSASV